MMTTQKTTIDAISFKDVPYKRTRPDNSTWDTEPEKPVSGIRCRSCTTESLILAGKKDGKKQFGCLICGRSTVRPLDKNLNP